jgi:PmbA protein
MGKRQGFSYSTDAHEYLACLKRALENTRWTEEDRFLGLPENGASGNVQIFDPVIESLSEEEVGNMALRVERSALETDRRIAKTRKTSVSVSSGEIFIVNSKGVSGSYKSTSVSSNSMVIAENGKESYSGWGYQGSRFLEDIFFEEIGRTAAKRALRLLGSRKIESTKASVLLDHSVAVDFLGIFASALSAESVQKGKSLLKGKIGTQVVSPIVDIVDNALIDRLLGSRPFDSEGVAARNKTLIGSGILNHFLHTTYTARRDNSSSTGNAVRAGFSSLPSVGITNFFLRPASATLALPFTSLLEATGEGLLVTDAMGMHTANPISGDFSVGITGLWVEGGTLLYPVKEALISGNILDLFRKVVACGDDLTFYGKIGSPSLLIKEVDISA